MSENGNEAKKYRLTRDGERDLEFEGERLASVSSHHYQGPRNTRWTEIRIYRTQAGKLVVAATNRTRWEGERDTFNAVICESSADVYRTLVEWSGDELSDLAKEALREADLDGETVEAIA